MADVTFPRHRRDDGAFRGADETLSRVLEGHARFVGERMRRIGSFLDPVMFRNRPGSVNPQERTGCPAVTAIIVILNLGCPRGISLLPDAHLFALVSPMVGVVVIY